MPEYKPEASMHEESLVTIKSKVREEKIDEYHVKQTFSQQVHPRLDPPGVVY